jgi:hypothetical protein
MNAPREPDRLIRTFLMEGDEVLQDPIYDEVRAAIERKRQWTFIGPWRAPTMNRFVTFGLGAAAVVVIGLFLGYQLLGPGNTGSGGPSATPQPTATAEPTNTPTASSSPSARYPTWYPPAAVADANGAGILSAGSHRTMVFSPSFSFTVPDGWVNAYDEPGYFTLFPDTPANETEHARSDELAHHVLMGLRNDPWFTCESLEDNQGATAAEIVAAMEANEVLAVSDTAEVAIGGLSGMQFDVRRNPDWTGTCPGDSGLPEGVDPDDERTRGVLLDVPDRGVLAIFVYSVSSAGHEAFFAEAMQIIESFQFSQ